MKFYFTILIATMLFGLCLIERRAKENAIINNSFRKNSTFSDNLSYRFYPNLKNLRPLKRIISQKSDFATRFSQDSVNMESINYQKSLLNISLSSPFLTRQ